MCFLPFLASLEVRWKGGWQVKDVEEEACMLFSQGRLRKIQHMVGHPICQFVYLHIYGETLTGSNFFLHISFEPDILPKQNKVR